MKLVLSFALLYALLGAAGLLLAIPPGYASPVFPAAGLALAGALQFGRRALPGIWLGSALLNLGHAWLADTLTPATAAVPLVIGLGATLQAWAGAALVQRGQGAVWRALEREADAFRFLLLGGVAAGLISATLGTGVLYGAGLIEGARVSFTWWNWYVGDTLGVLVFSPLALCVLNRTTALWRERLKRIVVPVLGTLGLAGLTFYGAARWETQTQETRLRTDGEAIAHGITDRLIAHREVLASLRHFIQAIPDFSFAQFELFTRGTLRDNPDIFALSIYDLITDAERPDFERRGSARSPLGPFQITEHDAQRRLIPAARRSDYVVVRYSVPLAGNQPAPGYDINSEPLRRAAIARARATDSMAVTAPILLVQETQPRVGLLEILPLAAPSPAPVPRQGREPPRPPGFVAALIKVDEMIDIATRARVPAGLSFHLTDAEAPDHRALLYRSQSRVPGPAAVPEATAGWSTRLRTGDRDWVLTVTTTEDYRRAHRPWLAWAVGVVGLLFATMLQVLMLGMTGRTAVIQRKNAQLLLAEKVFENSAEAIVVTDPTGLILSTNPAFSRITGYTAAEARGQNMRLLQSGRHGRPFYREFWRSLHADQAWQGEVWNRRKDGSVYPEWINIAAVRDPDGSTAQYVAAFSDITERQAAQERIEFLAYHDPLTRLPNRLLGMDRVQQAIAHARRHGGRTAILLMDLDKFKLVNDTHGHSVGDALLRGVAARLRRCVRQEDTLCRLSGDEFLVVLYEVSDSHGVHTTCERILRRLGDPFDLDQRQLHTSFSIGVALYPEDGESTETLMRNADTALYEAKRQGRNTYCLFDAQLNLEVVRFVETRDALRQALKRGEFELYYQPQIDLHAAPGTGRPIAAEALLRWNRPGQGLRLPEEFIAVAEESGLIVPIGAWVLHQACRQAAAWRAAGLPMGHVAVNLSAVQFRDQGLEATVLDALTAAGLAPGDLELELTETILIRDLERALAVVRYLQSAGVRLSIDDFGTGYASLSYLRHFNADQLKIDRSFVRDLAQDPESQTIVRAIIQMAKGLGLRTLAEGVADPGALALLRALGCDEAQGFLFAPPMSADAFADWLRTAAGAAGGDGPEA